MGSNPSKKAADYEVLVIGAAGVGQTSSINLVAPTLCKKKQEVHRFAGEIDEEMVAVDIVDSGQLSSSELDEYISKVDGFYFIYDITKRESFQEMRALRKRVESVKDTPYFPCIVVGNKLDLSDVPYYDFLLLRETNKTELQTLDEYYVEALKPLFPADLATMIAEQLGDAVDSLQQVRSSEGESLARTWGGIFVETSAKTNENMDLCMEQLVRVLRRRLEKIPRPYFRGMSQ